MNSHSVFRAGALTNEDTTGFNSSTVPTAFAGCGRMRLRLISRRRGRVIEPTTVRLPEIRTETRAGATVVWHRFWGTPLQPRMGAITVVVALKLGELHLQISSRPEKDAVQVFP
jgi:hypothetical protein